MKSFKELYEKRRTIEIKHSNTIPKEQSTKEFVRETTTFGTALAITTSIWELFLTSKFLWTWFIGIITDGYWMVFATPIAWVLWALSSIFYIPLFFILSTLVIASIIWTYTFELTASLLNKEHIKNYKPALLICTIIAIVIGGIIALVVWTTSNVSISWGEIVIGIIVLFVAALFAVGVTSSE
jgi:hypothetical protein